MITQKAKYALRALTLLARAEPGEPIQIPDIADKHKIPKKFLEQIMLDLKRGGMVESRRGKQGGYLLLRPANDITYGEVLRLIDGPVERALNVLRKLRNAFAHSAESASLGDAVPLILDGGACAAGSAVVPSPQPRSNT